MLQEMFVGMLLLGGLAAIGAWIAYCDTKKAIEKRPWLGEIAKFGLGQAKKRWWK